VASDLGNGSLVEAAIDDLVQIDCASCDSVVAVLADRSRKTPY